MSQDITLELPAEIAEAVVAVMKGGEQQVSYEFRENEQGRHGFLRDRNGRRVTRLTCPVEAVELALHVAYETLDAKSRIDRLAFSRENQLEALGNLGLAFSGGGHLGRGAVGA